MREIIVIAHDIRSSHNIGSLLRTADGFGVAKVYLTGYSPYPMQANDTRLPHIARKVTDQIRKTALGAEESTPWEHHSDIHSLLITLKNQGYTIAGLEQDDTSTSLPDFIPPNKIALLLGREVEGIEPELLKLCDNRIEIPMYGQKESFNVTQAAAVAMYSLREA